MNLVSKNLQENHHTGSSSTGGARVVAMNPIYRSLFVWGAGNVLVLGAFLIFVNRGWPGSPDPCTLTSPNTCFCEAFNPADVITHAPGVRQPMNTWFNLYATLTSLLVALVLARDRKEATLTPGIIIPQGAVMRSESWIPDAYVFAILFLGLGSMYFHASLTNWAGNLDAISMYIFATFPVIYTTVRLRNSHPGWQLPGGCCPGNSDLFFWVAYAATTLTVSILHLLICWEHKALGLITALAVAYVALETAVSVKRGRWWGGRAGTVGLWWGGVVAMAAATACWGLTQTGQVGCDPESGFQGHGMLWHPLAGFMALLLFFYWRLDEGTTLQCHA